MGEYSQIDALSGGRWSSGSGAGTFALNVHDLNSSPSIGCRIAFSLSDELSVGCAKPDMIRTEMFFISHMGDKYPIYYCFITERYFINLIYLLREVKYESIFEKGCMRRKWVLSSESLPVEGKERSNYEAVH